MNESNGYEHDFIAGVIGTDELTCKQRFKVMAYSRARIISLEWHIDMICIHSQIMLTLISRKVIDMPFDDKNIHMIPDEDLHDGYDSADDKDDND